MQRYVSRDLSHFVGRDQPDDESRFRLLVEVVRSGVLSPDGKDPERTGEVRLRLDRPLSSNAAYDGDFVCFADIPVEDLPLHAAKFGRFGLALAKTFLVEQGANPLYYVARQSLIDGVPRATAFDDMGVLLDEVQSGFRELQDSDLPEKAQRRVAELAERFERFTEAQTRKVLTLVKFFDASLGDDDDENFYMEREWRVIGAVRFTIGDVRRIIIPEEYAAPLREELPGYAGQLVFI